MEQSFEWLNIKQQDQPIEHFWHVLKGECINLIPLDKRTPEVAIEALEAFIPYYNNVRIQIKRLDKKSPIKYKKDKGY